MAEILVWGDSADAVAELAAAARSLGCDPVVLAEDDARAEAYAAFGAQRVVVLEGAADYVEGAARDLAAYAAEIDAQGLLVPSSLTGQALGTLVAGYLGWPMESDVTVLAAESEGIRVTRLLYGGAVMRDEVIAGKYVASVPAGLFEAEASGAPAPIERRAVSPDARIQVVSVEPAPSQGVDITKADRVLGIGMGLRSDEDLALAQQLAAALGAEIGGTRGIAEERHWTPDYIGISGLVIAPTLYVSMGISGQIQHVFGVRDSKVIVAIDANKDAPIFKAADYGIVGDYHVIAPKLAAVLS